MSIEVIFDLFPEVAIDSITNNPTVGLYMAETTAKHMEKYVPSRENVLASSYVTRPFEVEYTQGYANYQFQGELYLAENGSSWAKRFERKHPSGMAIQYSKNIHPLATDHWDVPTQENQGRKIASELTEFLQRL